jgi:glutamate dehydrogenase
MARSSVRDELYEAHAGLTRAVLESGPAGAAAEELLASWIEQNAHDLSRARQVLSEIWETERFDLATLSVALGAVRSVL